MTRGEENVIFGCTVPLISLTSIIAFYHLTGLQCTTCTIVIIVFSCTSYVLCMVENLLTKAKKGKLCCCMKMAIGNLPYQTSLNATTPYLSSNWGTWFLQEVPKFLLLVWAAGVIKFPFPISISQSLCFSSELLVHLLLLLVVSRLAARLQVDLIDAPVIELLAEWQRAHFLHHVQLSSSVKIQDRRERARVSVEEVLVLVKTVVIADFHQRLVCVTVSELA